MVHGMVLAWRRRWIALTAGLALAIAVLMAACANVVAGPAPGTLRILSYNTQNLFDDHKDGGEYPEFIPGGSGGWNRDAYRQRLERLATVIRDQAALPDIVVLEEIENAKVLEDLCAEFLPANSYPVRLLQADEGLIHIALLSKYPLQAERSHRIWQNDESCRSIWELHFGQGDSWNLVVLANHWKSKSGGEAASEALRIQAATIVRQRGRELRAANPAVDLVACGDFNEVLHDPGDSLPVAKRGARSGSGRRLDFDAIAGLGTRLRPAAKVKTGNKHDSKIANLSLHKGLIQNPLGATHSSLVMAGDSGGGGAFDDATYPLFALGRCHPDMTEADVAAAALWVAPWANRQKLATEWYSPWLADGSDQSGNPGSYRYQGKWEAIDHFLLAPGLDNPAGLGFLSFRVLGHPELMDGDGNPWRYDTRTGKGYSDHLPILVDLAIAPQ